MVRSAPARPATRGTISRPAGPASRKTAASVTGAPTIRPPISLAMDTDVDHKVVTEVDPDKREDLIADTWQAKRDRMKNVCLHCHTNDYVNAFYKTNGAFWINYNK